MMSDVSVVGLAPETVSLADIGMDVPHGVVVRISAEKASNSKDLWRAVNQRRVFRLQAGPNPPGPTFVPALPEDLSRLYHRIADLEKENGELVAALQAKDRELQLERSKFDEILALLRAGIPMAPGAPGLETARSRVSTVVEVDTPSYIPSTIKGDPSESRVAVTEGASEGDGISGARSALRKLRRNE